MARASLSVAFCGTVGGVKTAASSSGFARLLAREVTPDLRLRGRLTIGSLTFVPCFGSIDGAVRTLAFVPSFGDVDGVVRTLASPSLRFSRPFDMRASELDRLVMGIVGLLEVRVVLVGCEGMMNDVSRDVDVGVKVIDIVSCSKKKVFRM